GRALLPRRGRRGPGGRSRGGAGRGRPDRVRRLPARAHPAPRVGRVGGACARRHRPGHGRRRRGALACVGDRGRAHRRPARLADPAAGGDARGRAQAAAGPGGRARPPPARERGRRPDGGGARRADRDPGRGRLAAARRADRPDPRLAALVHVLSAARYQTVVDELRALLAGQFGTPPGPVDEAVRRAVRLVSGDGPALTPEADLDEVRARAHGLAASEEELLLLALFGGSAERLLQTIRNRTRRDEPEAVDGLGETRAERIREIVRIVQESGVGEVTIEDAGLRVTVRRRGDEARGEQGAAAAAEVLEEPAAAQPAPGAEQLIRVEAPMVGTFYRAPEPGAPPFVDNGDLVVAGQTLCILEAMKLMNEVKAEVEGIVRRIHVENAQPVEYGQLLFELEPVDGRPPAVCLLSA